MKINVHKYEFVMTLSQFFHHIHFAFARRLERMTSSSYLRSNSLKRLQDFDQENPALM